MLRCAVVGHLFDTLRGLTAKRYLDFPQRHGEPKRFFFVHVVPLWDIVWDLLCGLAAKRLLDFPQ